VLLAVLACSGGGDSTLTSAGKVLSTISVSLSASTIQAGQTANATAAGFDQTGAPMSLGTVTWTTGSVTIASVTASGAVTGVAPGTTTITAAAGGKQGSATLVVQPLAGDFAIADAQFTQGVQVADGSLPMVLSGNAAVVNVLVRAVPANATKMQVVLRIFDGTGALIRSDTAMTLGALGASPTYDAPNVQFLVPASVLQNGLSWQVVRDPKHQLADESPETDVFPRTGMAALATVSAPPLTIRFVPIVLSAHRNATGFVDTATLPQYLQTLNSIYPLGVVNAHVGAPLTTSATFGTFPAGGAEPFWQQVVAELDLARLADPVEPDANWFGVVVPPAGFNQTIFGGFSYIPLDGTSTGPGTRTSAAVQINWFNRPTQARDLVAHELGHTFGRFHAPCGGAGSPLDPAFPVLGGTLEQAGHDVFSWASGAAASAATVPASTGDVMGYCFPVWSSAYTYRLVLAFRGQAVVATAVRREARSRVLVVRGSIRNGNSIALEPVFALDARPSLRERGGSYTLVGSDAAGGVLVSYDFEPFVLDHAPNIRPFTIALPSNPDLERRLASIEVRGPAGVRRLDRSALPAAAAATELREATVVRNPDGLLTATCEGGSARGILVLEAGAGSVLGSAARSSMRLVAAPGSALSVVCSDGVQTQGMRVVAP
jgi:hypothetical protein